MVAVEFYSPVKPFELVDKPRLNQVNGAKVNARVGLSTAEGATDDLGARRGRITATMRLGFASKDGRVRTATAFGSAMNFM